MTPEPGTAIPIRSVPNLRDLGGWPVRAGGRVRRGQVYRSTELDRLAGADLVAFERLGIRVVYDLRTQAERLAQPDQLPDGTRKVVVDVFGAAEGAAPAQVLSVLAHPERAPDVIGGDRATAMFQRGYRDIVRLPSARAAYARMFRGFADPGQRPALFHCTTGKDRTGWGAAVLLLLLGVSDDDVRADYLRTNDDLLPALQPVFDQFAAAGGDPDLLRPVLGVRTEYLQVALDEMHRAYGDLDGYLRHGLGLDGDVLDALRAGLVVPG